MAQHTVGWVLSPIIIFFVLQNSWAVEQCKTGCSKDSGILNHTPGTTYKYDYDGKITIELSSAENQKTSTEVKAQVFLTQQADCSQVLRLQNVHIIGPDGKKRVGILDIEKPILLNSNNGDINDFICSEQGDTQNSLNLKRAIASFFQVNPNKNTEIDVFGQCPTQITSSQDGDILTISKTKNLNKCAFRESITHSYASSLFDINSKIQSSPVLDSNLNSKQNIKAGIFESANIVENYLFVPFSVGRNGAKATIESNLLLTGTSMDNPTSKCQIPKSIIFDNPHPVNLLKSNMNIILKKVKEISDKLKTNVEDSTAVQFVDLVKLLRVSRRTDILSVYNQVRSGVGFVDKESAKKIFLDAILSAGNGETIQVAVELLKNKELDTFEEQQLYAGLSKAKHVTESSIKAVTDLLNRENLPREAFLGIGALAGRYCAEYPCENVDVINRIIQKYLSKLGDLKAADRKEENDMIYILKGLANIGYLNEAILNKLVSLSEDKNQSTRLRIATLETFASYPCSDKLRDSVLNTLKDIQEDSEIRINAYLMLAQCPNEKIGNAIKNMLEEERSNQVGGFIVSHIKNIRSSSNPDKALAKTHLGFIRPSRKFDIDPTKYSINGEFSHSIGALGLANSIEGNIIYSQNSWLPRSTNLNLTAEVFGRRLNFLEITARQENLDKIIEHYLGPRGVLRKATAQENWDNVAKPIQNMIQNLKEKVDKSLRARRDLSKADIDAINEKVQIKTNDLDKNFDLDLSIKNSGSEIVFMNSFDLTDKFSTSGMVDKLVNKLNEGLDKLKSFDKTIRANLLILDAELSYPTSLGFPLRLCVDGASNIQIKTEGNIDVRNLLAPNAENDIDFKLSIIPSATVTIIGRFSLDTPLLENGLKVSSSIHTSSGGDLMVNTFKKGLGLDVKFKTPIEKQELFEYKHDIIFQSKENGVVLKNQRLKFSQNKDFSICIDQLVDYVGLEFCADINGPNLSGKKIPILPFPLSGDAKASLKIERGDIDTFHFRGEIFAESDKIGIESTLQSYGTTAKGMSVKVEAFSLPEKYVKINLNTPIKNGEAEVRLISNKKEKILSLYVKDEIHLYSAKVGVSIEGGGIKYIYKPILEYTTPNKKGSQIPPFHVKGQILSEHHGDHSRYHLDNIALVIPGKKNLVLSGFVGYGPGYIVDIKLSNGHNTASLKGHLVVEPQVLRLDAQMINSINPDLNFDLEVVMKKPNLLENMSSRIKLIHGVDLESPMHTFMLSNTFSLKKIGEDTNLISKNSLTYPRLMMNTMFHLEKTPKSFEYEAIFNYGERHLASWLKFNKNTKTEGDYQLQFKTNGLRNSIFMESSRQIVGADESKIINALAINGNKLEISGKVRHHVKPHDINIGSDLDIQIPKINVPVKLNGGLKLTSKDIDTHLKILIEKNPLVDTLLKANTIGNINGRIKVNVKEILQISGSIKSEKGVGSGNILLDAKSLKKSAKLVTSFHIHRPTYNIDVTLYPVFNVDKNKKLVISSKNKFTASTLDSSSTLEVLGSKLAVNVNADMGNPINGKTLMDIDLTLPSQQFLAGKLIHDSSTTKGLLNIDSLISFEQRTKKSTPGRKLIVKGVAKNTDFITGIFDVTITASAEDAGGPNVNVDLDLKRKKNGDKYEVNVNNKVSSSLLKTPIEMNFNSDYKELTGSFLLKTSVYENSHSALKGTYNLNEKEGPFSGELHIDVGTPLEVLSSFKTIQSFKISSPSTEAPISINLLGSLQTISSISSLKIDGTGSLKINGNKQVGQVEYRSELSKPVELSVTAYGNYSIDWVKKAGTVKGEFKAILPENKIIQGSSLLTREDPSGYHLEASLDLPAEKFKSNKLVVDTKHNESKDISSKIQFISDGRKYLVDTDLNLNQLIPSVSMKLIDADGKTSELGASVNRQNKARLLTTLKILCEPKEFLLEGSVDVDSENVDNLDIQVKANAPKLKINNVLIKIGKAEGNNSNILVQSDGKTVVSGSAIVSFRQENGRFIVEGSGNFKLNDKDQSGNFKYIRTTLTSDKNGENGEEVNFDATLGNKNIDADFKLTNKEFAYSNLYCAETKKCGHVKINAKTDKNNLLEFSNQIEVDIDLRDLGIPNGFVLKAVTKRDKALLDHTVDLHFQNALNKYQYSVYRHPKEAGISFSTPNRTIALEANGDVRDFSFTTGGKANLELAFYTDKKNDPNTKSLLKGMINADVPGKNFDVEIYLIAAGQSKPLNVKYREEIEQDSLKLKRSTELTLDIFDTPDKKFVIEHHYSSKVSESFNVFEGYRKLIANSEGLGINVYLERNTNLNLKDFSAGFQVTSFVAVNSRKHDSILDIAVSPQENYVLLNLMGKEILQVASDVNIKKGLINFKTLMTGLDLKPVESITEIHNYNTLIHTQYLKDDPTNKLVFSAAIIPGQSVETSAVFEKEKVRKELFHASVQLNAKKFLHHDSAVDFNNIKEVAAEAGKITEGELKQIIINIKEGAHEMNDDIVKIRNIVKENVPDFSESRQFYQSELSKIKEEIASDESLECVMNFLRNTIQAIQPSISKFITNSKNVMERLSTSLCASFSRTIKNLQTQIIPKLKDLMDQIFTSLKNVMDKVSGVLFAYIAKISEIIEIVLTQLNNITVALSEMSDEILKFVVESYESVEETISEEMKKIMNELKASPLIAKLRSHYKALLEEGLPSREVIINTLKAASGVVKELVIVPEIQNLIDLVENYLEKKISGKPVNDVAELKNISMSLIQGVQKIATDFIKEIIPDFSQFRIPVEGVGLLRDIQLGNRDFKVSAIDYILKEDTTHLIKFLLKLVVLPQDFLIPKTLYGEVSSTIFTFDRKIFLAPKGCKFLLAKDAVNGNFSIFAEYTENKLNSVIFSDDSGSYTITEGKVLLNNVETDLPIEKEGVSVSYIPSLYVLKSTAGVEILCSLKMVGCGFIVSGFYHGQIRGLLGNGNQDEFDDLILPNGKLTDSASEFFSSYALGTECPKIEVIEVTDGALEKTDEKCEKIFGWNSEMKNCYPFVSRTKYKNACILAAFYGIEKPYLRTSQHYAYTCWTHNIPVVIPPDHGQTCENSQVPRKVDDQFQAKLPGNSADILLMINIDKSNEIYYKEYIQPLVIKMTEEYKSKGITDINIILLIYGGKLKEHAYVTVKSKPSFQGNAPDLEFSEKPKLFTLVTGIPEVDSAITRIVSVATELNIALGGNLPLATHIEAVTFQFRVEAIKHVIYLASEPCPATALPVVLLARAVTNMKRGVIISYIYPVNLKLKDSNRTEDIIGFDSTKVFTMSNPSGTSELIDDLIYDNICADHILAEGGDVFVAQNLMANKNRKHKVIDIMAKSIIDRSLAREVEIECTCGYSFRNPFMSYNRCRAISIVKKSS